MADDRRDSWRVVPEAGVIHLEAPAGLKSARVVDISASGSGLLLPAGWSVDLERGPVTFRPGGHPAFTTCLEPVRVVCEVGGLARIGVRFESLGRSAMSSLSGFLIDRALERDHSLSRLLAMRERSLASVRRQRVHDLLQHHGVAGGHPLQVYRAGQLLPLILRIRELTVEAARELIAAEVCSGSSCMLDEGGEYVFSLAGVNAVNYFSSAVWRRTPSAVSITLPPDIRQTGFRSSPRAQPLAALRVQFGHPRLPGLRLVRPVLDVGARGLGFLADAELDLLFPGDRIRDLLLFLPDGPLVAQAVVRSLVPGRARGLRCGIEITGFADARDVERWTRLAFAAAHPRITLVDGTSVSRGWEALVASGYVDLVEAERLPELGARFTASWERHVAHPEVSRFFLLLRDERPVGSAAASLLYPRTWMPHLFGIDAGERQGGVGRWHDYAREIYSGMMFLLRHMAPLDHFVFYFDAKKKFHDRAFGRFLRRYPVKDDFVYDGFKLFKCVLDEAPALAAAPPDDLEIVPGDPRLLRCLSRHLEQTLPAVEVEAFCLGEAEIGLDDFSRECAARGYERERRIFFALRHGEPLAALVAETGDEGINIFSLFNRCWLVPLDPGAARDRRVEESLLRRARRFYLERDKQAFLLLGSLDGEPEAIEEERRLGLEYVADGLRWLARRSVIPAYMEYIENLFQHSEPAGHSRAGARVLQ